MTAQDHQNDRRAWSTHDLRVKMTLVISTLCFGFGFLNALAVGFEKVEAVKLALAWTISGLTGWGVYNLFWTLRRDRMFVALYSCLMGGLHIVSRTAEPWPFLNRLGFGVMNTVIMVLVTGVIAQVIGFRFDQR